jgi:hypothetical protein
MVRPRTRSHSRRRVLRGMLAGSAVSVALPFLDSMLNDSGTALAAGLPLPVRFGTWFWGLGHTPGYAVADKATTGPGISFMGECEALKRHAGIINYFGKFNLPLDGRSNYPHTSGWVGSRTGVVPDRNNDVPATTFDLLIADEIGNRTRLKTIDLTCTGNPDHLYSARSTHTRTSGETSPAALYQRLFGADFVDPNKADFKPDPRIMARKSALSAVTEERRKLMQTVGASDRAQLDGYFTSIRELENQLAVQLEKPAPNLACRVPTAPADQGVVGDVTGVEISRVEATHETFARLLAMAVACNQTHVFNMVFSDSFSGLRRQGETLTHHSLSHEERVDAQTGRQPQTSWFNLRSMESLARFIDAFAAIREGDGTLLDNVLLLAASETSLARTHSIDGVPFMTVGRAGGRIKTGLHVVGNGDPATRVGLTAMQIMGVSIDSWGVGSLKTSKAITDILA